jgi:hypothetical protein
VADERADLDDFVARFRSGAAYKREESERFRKFPLETLLARDKMNLDIFWAERRYARRPRPAAPARRSRGRGGGELGGGVGQLSLGGGEAAGRMRLTQAIWYKS